MPESSPAKRACDACHRRKVRCVGDVTKSCKNCNQAGLKCTYNTVPQKKGPKGSRAKVISELREHQRQSQLSIKTAQDRTHSGSSPVSPVISLSYNTLTTDLIDSCVDFFFANMYPTQPILHREKLRQTIANMDHSPDAYCMITTLCAYMMIQPNMQLPPSYSPASESETSSNLTLGHALLEEAFRIRKTFDYSETPSITTVITSFFLFGCHFCLERQNLAWFHLREASTFALVLGMEQESTYSSNDNIESIIRRRLYWLLFVTERAYAMQKSRPLTLHATINLPIINEDEETELTGFSHLIFLFKPFDDTFVGLWNQSIDGCRSEWIQELQLRLSEALPRYLKSTEIQAVDLRTSQKWLHVMIWQLAISHRLLSSTALDEAMTFKYPIELSRALIQESKYFTQQAMEVHGIGLTKKLFDVACTLIDVLTYVPVESQGFELGPRDYLNHFLHLISRLRGGQDRFLPLLLSKVHDTLPAFAGPIPHVLPSSLYGQFDETPPTSIEPGTSMSQLSSPFVGPIEPNIEKLGYADLLDTSTFPGASGSPFPDETSHSSSTFSPPPASNFSG